MCVYVCVGVRSSSTFSLLHSWVQTSWSVVAPSCATSCNILVTNNMFIIYSFLSFFFFSFLFFLQSIHFCCDFIIHPLPHTTGESRHECATLNYGPDNHQRRWLNRGNGFNRRLYGHFHNSVSAGGGGVGVEVTWKCATLGCTQGVCPHKATCGAVAPSWLFFFSPPF